VYSIIESTIDVKIPHKVLIVGIGRSNVIDVLYSKGFREITAIDVSPVIIAQMQEKYRTFSGVDCKKISLLFFLLRLSCSSLYYGCPRAQTVSGEQFFDHHRQRLFGLYLLWFGSL
jgi:hypothetical protein